MTLSHTFVLGMVMESYNTRTSHSIAKRTEGIAQIQIIWLSCCNGLFYAKQLKIELSFTPEKKKASSEIAQIQIRLTLGVITGVSVKYLFVR